MAKTWTIEEKRAYQLTWITARRKKYLAQMGCCFFCGSLDKIEIHHLNPAEKESHHIWSWSDERIDMELRKCIAMCHSCHVRFHAILKMKPIPHGHDSAYRIGCRCEDCRKAHTEQRMEDRRRRRSKEVYL